MIAAIGPFWDANETWLVLGVGILLVAFPSAHGAILGALYLPVTLMLAGLILRGVAFDFRVKAQAAHKPRWDAAFCAGSVLAALSQGFMLGAYILGFEWSFANFVFASFIGLCLLAGYALLGAGWLILKTEDALRAKAVRWAQAALWLTGLGIGAVSLATPMVSARIFEMWFAWPGFLWLAPIPLASAALWLHAHHALRQLRAGVALPEGRVFACTVGLYASAFAGLAWSLYPYLVVDRIRAADAAAAPESLRLILAGVVVTLPAILGYSAWTFHVFRGKARPLRYEA